MPPIANPVPIPSPWGGINARDGVAALQPQDARSLVNWNPDGNSCKPRKGYTTQSTSAESNQAVATLAPYSGASGTAIIGVSGGKIYDFTSATATELYDGMYADGRFQTECYNNYLFGVNGTETPWAYNGSTIVATGFSGSGLTLTDLINVKMVRNRLWFCEKDSADVWYGGLGSITGSLTKFQLSQVSSGGYCMAIGAHSQDAGAGPDDYTAFIMSTGEVILYSGDPSSTFTKVGNYKMPAPVGRQCLINIGGPLAVLTHMGLIPLQSAVAGLAFDMLAIGNYGKAGPAIKTDIDSYIANTGWHMVFHEGRVIINVPQDTTVAKQWVFNSLTGAWTTWEGVNTKCFCVVQAAGENALFFGGVDDGAVHKQYGATDNGDPISVSSRSAYVIPGNGRKVKATAIQFAMQIEGTLTGGYSLDLDFLEGPITTSGMVLAGSTDSTPWGSDWGSEWSTTTQYAGQWRTIYGEGHSLGLSMEADAMATSLSWEGAHVLVRGTGI